MKIRKLSSAQFVVLSLFVSSLALAPAVGMHQPGAALLTNQGGTHRITFETAQGRVIVNLPDDMRAGDTISGTLVVDPKGPGTEGPSQSLELLFDTFKTINVPASGSPRETFTFKIPVSAGNDRLTGQSQLTLRNKEGAAIQTVMVPFSQPLIFASSEDVPPPLRMILAAGQTSFFLPTLGQQGRSLEIPGPFDGDFQNTTVDFGGRNIPVIAESPRKAIFESPTDVTGPTEITLNERNVETKGPYRNLGVHLSAPKTNLMRGERTTLTIEISGLEGIKKDAPLQLDAKGVITMDGGNFQNLRISPSEVNQAGRYTTTRNITGQQPGNFTVTATVIVSSYDMKLQDDVKPADRFFWNSSNGEYFFTGGAPLRFSGTGKPAMKGCIITLSHNAPDRRVFARLDVCTKTGDASIETTSPKTKVGITDKNTNDTPGTH